MIQCAFRETETEDGSYLKEWLLDKEALQWFPMSDEREIDDAVRIWVGYNRLGSAITALDEQGCVCGMATLYIQPFKKYKHQCLFSIIVGKRWRGQGVGSQLIEYVEKIGREKFHIEILHLEVYDKNPAARLYERMGFKEFGRHSSFIKDQTGKYFAKIFMQKRL